MSTPKVTRVEKRRKKAGKRGRHIRDINGMAPLNENWLVRDSKKEGVKDS